MALTSTVGDIISEGALSPTGAVDLDTLRDEAMSRAGQDAESAVIYYSHALDILNEYSSDDPDESEVEPSSDWRKVMTATAYLTARAVIERKVSEDIDLLREAISDAEGLGFEAIAIHSTCLYGWAPHRAEVDAGNGTICDWPALEGGPDRYLMSVVLDDCTVWVALTKDSDEE